MKMTNQHNIKKDPFFSFKKGPSLNFILKGTISKIPHHVGF